MAEVEGRGEDVLRRHVQAGEDLRVGPRDPGRGVGEALAIGVLADADEQLAHRALDALGIEGAHRRRLAVEGDRDDRLRHR